MKKRLICAVLATTMIFSMTACGTEKKIGGNRVTITVDELQENVVDALKNIDSAEIDLSCNFGASKNTTTERSGVEYVNTYNYSAGLSTKALITVGTPATHINYSLNYNTSKNEAIETDEPTTNFSNSGEFYVTTDKETLSYYFNIGDGKWKTDTLTYEELGEEATGALTVLGENSMTSGLIEQNEGVDTNLLPTISNKTVESEGKECYEVIIKQDKSSLEGILPMFGEMIKEFDGTLSIYIEVETNLPIKMVYTTSVQTNQEPNDNNETMNVNSLGFTVLAKYNCVSPIAVPSDVVDNATKVDYSMLEE